MLPDLGRHQCCGKFRKCCGEILAKINGKKPEETTATLCQFHSGEVTNMLPNQAEAVMDIRIKTRN